jgi:hypothetical protein
MRQILTAACLALATAGGVATSAAASAGRIADDYPRALAEARRRGVPLFLDAWAHW